MINPIHSPNWWSANSPDLTPEDIFLESRPRGKGRKSCQCRYNRRRPYQKSEDGGKYDSNPLYDMSAQAGISGTTKFVLV